MNAAPLPVGFKYVTAFMAGRPIHTDDRFSIKHPKMDRGKRAKIFAPFDALDGYSESIDGKNIEYVERIELEDYEKSRLDHRFRVLHDLTRNGRMARTNRVTVSVKYYVPCMDEENFAFLRRGSYVTETGICWKVDADVTRTMLVGETEIPLDDVIE
ncbi:MAG: hypothetical protein J6N53_08260, partial [Lachnospiraceae bacterium]|nr:hypothetical protein [Lachnospiraceae bacterium]